MEVQVQAQHEVGVEGELEVMVEGDVEAEEDDDTGQPTFETNEADSTNFDFGDEDGDSDELDTLDGSDDEGDPKVRFPRFKVLQNDEDVKFQIGLQFSNKKQILEAIKTFGIMSKKNTKVVTFKDQHYFFRIARNSHATPDWVAKRLISLLMHTPDMKLKALIAYGVEKWGIRLTMDQAYKTKVKGMEKIEGATRDQYKHLRSYVAEMLEKKQE
eukprot:XP_006606638.1 uncharacterized protein LOC102663497 [Glycine max]